MNDPRPPEPPPGAWARVRILLNLGRLDEAAREASVAAQPTRWACPRVKLGGPDVFGHPDLPVGWCFLDPGADLAVLNSDILADYSSMIMFDFVRACESLEAPTFRWYDVANWKLLRDMDDAEYEARIARGE